MLYCSKPKKVFYFGRAVDFRKQALGLASLVDLELPGEMRQGHWFVFVSTDKKKAKILYWRGTGIALWQMRLESELFKVLSPRLDVKRTVSWRDLGRLLAGQNIFAGDAHQPTNPKRFS